MVIVWMLELQKNYFSHDAEVCLSTLSGPMLDFTIEHNEKIFLDPDFSSIDTMLKLLTSIL